MRQRYVVRSIGAAGLAIAFGALLTACPEDATDLVKPVATALDFAVAPAVQGLPGGALVIDRLTLAEFDTTVSNALGTSTPGAGSYYEDDLFDCCGGWRLNGFDRNSSTDPRTPLLTDDDAFIDAGTGEGLNILDPSGLCSSDCPFHNPFTDGTVLNLTPGATYIVALFRYGISINGQLDAGLVARGQPLDTPDDLVPVGGSPAGDPTLNIESFPTFAMLVLDANPMILGNFVANALGEGGFDVVVDGTGILYEDISGGPSAAAFDSSLVSRNDDTLTAFPRYNYLVVLEGPATDAADAADNPQALRVQIGQDFLASTGEMVNNAYAPFPLPFTIAELINAPGGAGRPDSVTLTIQGLDSLAGSARWQLWLANRDREPVTMIPGVGTYEKIQIIQELDPVTGEVISERDSVVRTDLATSTFEGQGGLFKHRITLTDADATATDSVGFFTDAFLTVEATPGGVTPSEARAVWFNYTDQGGTPDNFFDDVSQSGTLLFGTFNLSSPSLSRTVSADNFVQAQGLGGILGSAVSVDVFNLAIPPVGFYYEGWLTGPEGNVVSMGPLRSPPPESVSLIDADVSEPHEVVVPGVGIRHANAFIELASPSDIVDCPADPAQPCTVNLSTFFVTLEPKESAATKGPSDLVAGVFPLERIFQRRGTE